ncbi:MAG: DUF4410 domain-containing protein [Candidatus Acidiferrum sp.]
MYGRNLSILTTIAIVGLLGASLESGSFVNASIKQESHFPAAPAAVAFADLPGQQTDSPTPVVMKDQYKVVQVEKFDVQDGIDFPPEYSQRLQDEIVKQFEKSRVFSQVLLPGQSPAGTSVPALSLTGTITYFDSGSRGKRYVGFGMGAGNIVALVVFRDLATGEPRIVVQVPATLSSGAFGGSSENIARELAKRLDTALKLYLETPLLPSGETGSSVAVSPSPPGPDQKSVTISGGAFDQAQADLNSQAAAGYRLVAFTPHGTKTADVRMAPLAAPQGVYQYRIFHVQLVTNLAKDLNKAALEGYRYCPRTLSQVAGAVGVAIAEKPPQPSSARYTYRLHAAMQLSNLQKDVAKDQRDDFHLVGTLEIGGVHIALTEKAVENPMTQP